MARGVARPYRRAWTTLATEHPPIFILASTGGGTGTVRTPQISTSQLLTLAASLTIPQSPNSLPFSRHPRIIPRFVNPLLTDDANPAMVGITYHTQQGGNNG